MHVPSPSARTLLFVALAVAALAPRASAQSLEVLHSFSACQPTGDCSTGDGAHPGSTLTLATDGNFYGTTAGSAGTFPASVETGYGTIFRITPAGAYSVLHRFLPTIPNGVDVPDGCFPVGRLAEGVDGALYGVTASCGGFGDGTIFRISTAGTFTKLHDFDDGNPNSDRLPQAGLTRAGDGNFYGTTTTGGTDGFGSIYRVTPAGVVTTLHSFDSTDGKYPSTDLTLASDGRLYGVTSDGPFAFPACTSTIGCGVAFSIGTDGSFSILHKFTNEEARVRSALTQSANGDWYGTLHGQPSVYRLSPAGAFTRVYQFAGGSPWGAPVFVGDDLYGTLADQPGNSGVLYKLTTSGDFSALYTFAGPDGSRPLTALAVDAQGRLYGTTHDGGVWNRGTVFRYTPAPAAPQTFTIGVTLTGSGNVISAPGGLACAPTCSAPFPSGTALTLTAWPAPGASFSQWINCPSPSGPMCALTVAEDRIITAIFTTSSGTPAVSLSPTSVTFGKQRVGSAATSFQTVTLTNTGSGTLNFVAFNGQPPSPSFSAGDFQISTGCPTIAGLIAGQSCTFSIMFMPTVAGLRTASVVIATNAGDSPHTVSLSGTGFVVDEATIVQTVSLGGTHLQALQNPDGGWYWYVPSTNCFVGDGISCPNTIGVTGLGLLARYFRTGDEASLNAAIASGAAVIADHDEALTLSPKGLPKLQDLEFLKALADLTGNQSYLTTAVAWFRVLVDQYPDAAARVDVLFARRAAQSRLAVGAWDAASLVRAAKAVGFPQYAQAAAAQVVARELEWRDTNSAHRWDLCPTACGAPNNVYSYDDTLLAEGSLLWAIHDLPGFDDTIAAYRARLLSAQDFSGSWDAGMSQVTAYVMLGLAASGGEEADAALRAGAAWFIANQNASGGWPIYVVSGVPSVEVTEIDAEIVRALAALFSTPAGTNVAITPSQVATITFSSVSSSGVTTMVTVDPATVPAITGGFQIVEGLAYEISTSASFSGEITVCFSLYWITDQTAFDNVRIMHGENGMLVDRTLLAPHPLAPDFATRRVCALVSSLSPFAVALAPDTTPPVLSVAVTPAVLWPANRALVDVTAAVTASDDSGGAPIVQLVSIASNEPDSGLEGGDLAGDIQGAATGTDDRAFKLRAERGAKGSGRSYTITYRATDAAGNSADATAVVRVPHDQRKR